MGPYGDIMIYAQWTPNQYSVFFDANGGASDSSDSYTVGSPVPFPEFDPTRDGYTFTGWWTASSGGDSLTDPYTYEPMGPYGDIMIYAQWTPGTYTITYDSNTGDTGGVDPSYYTTEGPAFDLRRNDPAHDDYAKSHYNFSGWSLDQCVPDSECSVFGQPYDTRTVTSDTTLYAIWNPQSYTIVYDTTTATDGLIGSDTYTWGRGGFTLPDSPFGDPTVTKLHYNFGGWYFGEDTTTVYTDISDADSFIQALTEEGQSITFHALWNLAIYHITYNPNFGTHAGTGSVADGSYLSGDESTHLASGLPLHMNGFTFAGWTLTPNNAGTSISTYGDDSDVTVYAYWVPEIQASNPGGNTVITNPAPTVTAISPTPGVELAAHAVTITGTNFVVGATVTIGGVLATGVTVVNSTTITATTSASLTVGVKNVVVTNPDAQSGTGVGIYSLTAAPIAAVTYSVSYDSQGGSAASGGSPTYVAGGSVTLPSAPTRAGFTFNGWFVAATGGTALGATYSPSGTGSITIYAQWTAIPVVVYTVTFNGNGSTGGSMATQSGSAAAALTSNGFTRTGFTFSGWNTVAAGGGTAYANGATYSFSASVTLYAQWTAITYVVTFDTMGGSAVSPRSYATGGSVALPSAPTRSGFTFGGWFLTETDGTILGGTSYAPPGTGDITIYAHWIGKKATVKYNSRGGSAVASEVTTAGTDITLADAPTRGGYAFLGWFEAATGGTALDSPYTVTGNVTLFAHWKSPKLVGFVLFGNDVRTVGAANSNATLNAIAAAIKAGEFTNVSLTGYFSNVGTLDHNKALAADRAANAQAYLVKRLAKIGYDGVTSWTVNSSVVANFGSDAQNRRVQVYGS
jgi:uncharacterized repeat protein (TIGR02543 family)